MSETVENERVWFIPLSFSWKQGDDFRSMVDQSDTISEAFFTWAEKQHRHMVYLTCMGQLFKDVKVHHVSAGANHISLELDRKDAEMLERRGFGQLEEIPDECYGEILHRDETKDTK